MGRQKDNVTPLAVFLEFHRITKEFQEKYGEITTQIARNYMYGQAAKLFNIQPDRAARLIRQVMRDRKRYESYRTEALELMAMLRNCKTPMKKFG